MNIPRKPIKPTREQLDYLYNKCLLSYEDMAQITGWGANTLRVWMVAMGLKGRTRKQGRRLKPNIPVWRTPPEWTWARRIEK